MIRQIVILIFLILFTGVTLFLYGWKAKKEIVYRRDERWKSIQAKALVNANYLTYGLLWLIGILSLVTTLCDIRQTFTWNNVLMIGLFYVGINNTIELATLLYFDRRM